MWRQMVSGEGAKCLCLRASLIVVFAEAFLGRSSEVTYLPVATLPGANERRNEEVSYQMDCRVNPESCSRAACA